MKNSKDLKEVMKEYAEKGAYSDYIDHVTTLLEDENTQYDKVDLLMSRGDCYIKLRKFGDALRDYRNALNIDAENVTAKTKIGMVENILSIENTFYYENAYTDQSLFPEM